MADLSKPNTVIVSRTEADGKGLHVGDTIPMTFAATGKQEMTVVGIFEPNQLFNDYAISLDTYDANVEQVFDLTVFVNVAPGVSVQAAESKLETFLAQNYPSVQVSDQEQFKQQQLQMIDQLFAIVYVLLFLSIIISLFGIVNTLGLSIYERIRELGLLRAVGLSRKQTKRMVRVEAVIIAVLGAVLGLVDRDRCSAGRWCRRLKDLGISTLKIPVGQLIVMLILAALLGVVAAIWPARRAAKLNVLEAISYE